MDILPESLRHNLRRMNPGTAQNISMPSMNKTKKRKENLLMKKHAIDYEVADFSFVDALHRRNLTS